MITLVLLLRILSAALWAQSVYSLRMCENAQRKEVKFYFDRMHKMCLSYRTDCESRIRLDEQFYNTEEDCTLENMSSVWKSVKIRCPADLRMAVFERSNGDQVPYLFKADLCHEEGTSDMCEKGETCNTVNWLAFCCNDEAFLGEGPNLGVFNITGVGGPEVHIQNAALFQPPTEAPINCNEDGDRNEVEWYRSSSGKGCVAQRAHCSTPKFGRQIRRDVFPDEQSCMNFWFPNEKFAHIFDCKEDGFAVASSFTGVPYMFEKRLCGGLHDSDFCNRDEFCSSFNDVGFCCQRSADSPLKYTSAGVNVRDSVKQFVIGKRVQFPNVRFFPTSVL